MNIIVNGGSSKAGRLSWMHTFNLLNVAVPFTPSHDTKVWNLVFNRWFESFHSMPNRKLKCWKSGDVFKYLDAVRFLGRYLSKLFFAVIQMRFGVSCLKNTKWHNCARAPPLGSTICSARARHHHTCCLALRHRVWTSIDPHRFLL